MLKLVAVAPPVPSAIRPGSTAERSAHLRCVALLQLEPEFARYLARHLRAAWPGIEIILPSRLDALTAQTLGLAQLIVCGIAPTQTPCIPTLWLSEIERSAAVVQIYPMLWKIPTPITGRDLIRAIEWILAAPSKDYE